MLTLSHSSASSTPVRRFTRLAVLPVLTAVALVTALAPAVSAAPGAAAWEVSSTVGVGPGPNQFAFSPDATRLYVTAGDGVDVIDTATNQAISRVSVPSSVGGIAVTPAGDIYVAGSAGIVYVIDPDTSTVVAEVALEVGAIGMTISGDSVYVTNGTTGVVHVIDTTTNTVESTVSVGANPVQATAIDGTVYVTNAGSGSVSAIDAATDTVIATIPVGGFPIGVTSAAGRVYAVEGISQSVTVIDAATNTVVDSLAVGGGSLTGIAATSDGGSIFVNQSDTDTVAIIDTDGHEPPQTVSVGARPGGAIVAPGNTTAYVTNGESASVSVLIAASEQCIGIACLPTGSFGG
ncbi:PQQ-binding-like beta-propeller repeat protein [Rhodococcoides kyotonense]|uniref:40-residue YVTN family beta-propeller repeat-containing protein n=1 Tax=Rhodococcoides kyotonense TaxID=398843 RepID=A0A239MZU5_9NOCA|nr:PQQ-binding-like beta-propeller repeat protein [Rhodococcus kyotonensis]SNT47694.1 40-residue YVTN family beta-propeller repeat-containing protein [Rhodococcus kyotonensis]